MSTATVRQRPVAGQPASVAPIRPDVIYAERGGVHYTTPPPRPCAVCAVVIVAREHFWACNGCEAWMHGECYWGRVASMAEWLAFHRQLDDGPEDYSPAVRCPACRAKGGA